MNRSAPTLWEFSLAAKGLPEPVHAPRPFRLLLVDDEPRMLDSLHLLLDNRGFLISKAVNGTQALEQLSQNEFDLVILDLHLPDMTGHDIMDFMNAHKVSADVIVTSGASDIDAAIGALKRGAYDYLRKPYSREELLKAVNNALERRRLEAENGQITRKLEDSERVYRHLVNNSPDLIFTLDAAGIFTFVNDRVQTLLGFAGEDLLGRHYAELVHAQDMERANFVFADKLRRERWSRNVELRLKTHNVDDPCRSFSIELTTITIDPPHGAPNQEVQYGTYGIARDITANKRADALITHQAYHDILTDLPNRVLFKDRLSLALLQAKRNKVNLAVMFLDLDRFKLINDSLGLQVGDELLQLTVKRLKACLRQSDTLSRFGSDEFNLVLPVLEQCEDAAMIANAFLDSLRQPVTLCGQTIHITASIGIAVYPRDAESVDELIRNAALAMHAMKTQGGNGYAFFNPSMSNVSYEKIILEHELHMALTAGELEMYYQPQVDVLTGKISGVEALMRWNHPTRGFQGANNFLPFAEESGLIIQVTDWMLDAVCRDLLDWNALSDERINLSINLSPHYLERGDFIDKLKATLDKYHISPSQIEVEVTENICIRNPMAAIEQLNKLCQLGVRVAIDDFGTGYSSLSYLHLFPIHILKIDRSFVEPIVDEKMHFPVVLAIISVAKGLGLKLVAEGVETAVQQRYLQLAGCQTFQGFYYHKPMQQIALLALLTQQAIVAA